MKSRKEIERHITFDSLECLTLGELLESIEFMAVEHYIEESLRPNSGRARCLSDKMDKVKAYIQKVYH